MKEWFYWGEAGHEIFERVHTGVGGMQVGRAASERDAMNIINAHNAALAAAPSVPDLMPVILWLENGCDPKEAAKELRIYQERRDADAPEAPSHNKEQQ